MSLKQNPRVVVIGGGFAGIQFIRKLDKSIFDVLLIDKVNHYQFQPLFYQVATSQIEPASISFPMRNIFRVNLSVRNRLVIFINWAWLYLTKNTSLRLILMSESKLKEQVTRTQTSANKEYHCNGAEVVDVARL